MSKLLKIEFILAISMLTMLAIPTMAQNTTEPNKQVPADTSMVFGSGQNGSTGTDYDYEALIKELYGSDEKPEAALEKESASIDKSRKKTEARGPAPGMFTNSRLNGAYLSFNMASPYAVSGQLESWYSYIDAGIAVKLPYEVYVESIPLFFLFEVSSFSFENTYPQGGSFAGISYIVQAAAIGDQASAALGFGFWDSEMGSMLELGYRFRPTQNTFLRVGTRGVLITNIDLIGSAWWAELRLSMGFEL